VVSVQGMPWSVPHSCGLSLGSQQLSEELAQATHEAGTVPLSALWAMLRIPRLVRLDQPESGPQGIWGGHQGQVSHAALVAWQWGALTTASKLHQTSGIARNNRLS